MKSLVIASRNRAAFGNALGKNQLFALQLVDLIFIGPDDCRAVRFDDPVEELTDFFVHARRFQLERGPAILGIFRSTVPKVAEDSPGQIDQFARWRERPNERFQSAFDLRPSDGLAVQVAAALAAHIVRIAPAFSLRPCSGHGMATFASHDPAHREIGVDVFARRRFGFAREAILYQIEGFEIDQPFMLPLADRHGPRRHFHITGIKNLVQDLIDALVRHFTVPVGRKRRRRREEALKLGLRTEATGREAFQSFLYDRGQRFVADQTFAATGDLLEPITPRSLKHPIAVEDARTHTVFGLLGVFLALVLCRASQHIFDEQAVRVLAKHDGGRFKNPARRRDVVA